MSAPGNADVPLGKNMKRASDALGPPTSPSANGRSAGEDASAPRGWYSRGYLPHCDGGPLLQSITYRLADSLPQARLASLREELEHLPEKQREIERRKRIEAWLDAGLGCCALAHPEVAQYVQNSFLHFHGVRYRLHAWCIMPNHVHVLIEPLTDLAAIVRGWKSFTARWILARNASLGLNIPSPDQLWMREYWDRYIRDARHYERTVAYIHENPVKAGLCSDATAWPWSSAYPGNAGVPAGKTSTDAEEYPLGTPMSPSANLKTAGEDAGDPRSFR